MRLGYLRPEIRIFALIIITLTLAALALLSYSFDKSSTHILGTEVFGDLAGAGALLSGIGAMAAVWISYLTTKQKGKQESESSEVIIRAMARIDGPLQADDLRALAELARAVNSSHKGLQNDDRKLPSKITESNTGLITSFSINSRDLGFLTSRRRRWRDFESVRFAASFPTNDIKPPRAYPDPVYLFIPGHDRGTALVSDAVDQALVTKDMATYLDVQPYHLPEYLKGSAHHVRPKIKAWQAVSNSKIVGMRNDPLPYGPEAPRGIRLHIARLHDAQCSNEICAFRFSDRIGEWDFDPRRELLRNPDGELRMLEESQLADCIGISTVAFTADNALILKRPTADKMASGLLEPSGSGSLEPRDLDLGVGILQDIVRRGMRRELCKEAAFLHNKIGFTNIVGFARWLDRGAKPEFFGITRLHITSESLESAGLLTSQGSGIFTVPVNLWELGRELADGIDLLSASSLPDMIRDSGSLRLLLALRAAATSIRP